MLYIWKGGIIHTTTAVSTILGDVSTMVTSAIAWVGDYAEAITGSPLLLMFVVTGFIGLGVGLIRRIISL